MMALNVDITTNNYLTYISYTLCNLFHYFTMYISTLFWFGLSTLFLVVFISYWEHLTRYRRSRHIHFSYQACLSCHIKTCTFAAFFEEVSPSGIPRRGPPWPWKFSDDWTAWGIPHTKTVSSKNWEDYNLGVHSTFTRWLLLDRLVKVNYRRPLGLNSFA